MTPVGRLALLAAVAFLLFAAAVHILFRLRMTAPQKEKRRRAMINRIGRMSDAMLTDTNGDTLYYLY